MATEKFCQARQIVSLNPLVDPRQSPIQTKNPKHQCSAEI